MYITCFSAGLAGDLVTAVIDSKNAFINDKGKVILDHQRNKLKHTLLNDTDSYLSDIFKQYKSIPSHQQVTSTYNTIAIDVRDESLYLFAAERVDNLNSPDLKYRIFGVNKIEELADISKNVNSVFVANAEYVIYFDDILDGKLIEKLQEFVPTELDQSFYNKWLRYWGNR